MSDGQAPADDGRDRGRESDVRDGDVRDGAVRDGDARDGDARSDVRDGDDDNWERPAPRYRPGRGGFDPEAAALAAQSRARQRQRTVLILLGLAILTAIVAAVALPALWWVHGIVDVSLVGYLVYLRRQVRMEEAIRERRAARMAGGRTRAAEDPELDEWAHRGREVTRRSGVDVPTQEFDVDRDLLQDDAESDDARHEPGENLLDEEPEQRVSGTGAPLPKIVTSLDELTVESALPRLEPCPTPPLPAGTVLVEAVEDDPALHELDEAVVPGYRRAVGE